MRRLTFVFLMILGMAIGYSLGTYAAKGRDAPGTSLVMPTQGFEVSNAAEPLKINAPAFNFMRYSKPLELPAMVHRRQSHTFLPLKMYTGIKFKIADYSFANSKINSCDYIGLEG